MICFDSRTQIVLSDDLGGDICDIVHAEHAKDAAVILDSELSNMDAVRALLSALETKVDLRVHTIETAEPTTDMVNEHAGHFKGRGPDIFIGIGGGSIIDMTKALSVMAVNDGKVEDYHGTGKAFVSGVKKIMVPTTAGTGSEVTPGAVLLNASTKLKRAICGVHVAPDYAVLDAGLTISLPDDILAYTGMDALGHAVESYTAKCANEITRMYSKQAFYLVANNLPRIFQDRRNIGLRQKVLLGSCLAGCAIHNSNTGACHSMAYALGIYKGVPHGLAVARLLPHVIRLNVNKGCALYSDLYALLDETGGRTGAEKFASFLEGYVPLAYIGRDLRDYNIKEDDLKFLAERGLDLSSALNNNPIEFTLDDAKKVLENCIGSDPDYVNYGSYKPGARS